MASSQFRDDNAQCFYDPGGFRPDFTTIARASTGASITEMSLATLNVAANQSERKLVVLRVVVVGANPAYFSLGLAGTPPGANTAMITMPANVPFYFKATAQDVSAYHQQITGSSTIEITALV